MTTRDAFALLPNLLPVTAPAVAGLLRWLHLAWQMHRTRRDLARLDDRMLRDIGVSRAEALAETERSAWDLTPRPRGVNRRGAAL